MAGVFTHNGNIVEGLPSAANMINYDNTSSGIQATQLQAAVDELNTNKQSKTDNSLTTTDKTITGSINELKSGFTNLSEEVNGDATTYPYADVITIEDAVPANLADCSVKIEPVQDLHGQSAPYVGGAGKNKLPLVLAEIKTLNVDGTWNGNTYTHNGCTYDIATDDGGNITSITANRAGQSSSDSKLTIARGSSLESLQLGSAIINGISGGNSGTYFFYAYKVDNGEGGVYVVDGDLAVNCTPGDGANITFQIKSDYNAQNVKVYPMIRLSTETDATFAPYTNICPISGHTEASVQRAGKSLLDIPDKTLSSSGWAIAQTSPISVEAGTYTLTYDFSGTANSSSLVFYDKNNVEIARGNATSTINGRNTSKVVLPQKAYYFNMYSNAVGTYTNFMFESGEDATPYEPYAGKTYTIALGDTIYGGKVRIDSNGNTVMDVDSGILDLGSLTYTYESQYARFTSDIVSAMKAGEPRTLPLTCECYEVIDDGRPIQNVSDSSIYNRGGSGGVHIQDSRYTDPSDFATALDGMQLVYPLATPTTIQLTPQQIQLLQGQNTITASTGQISVTVNGVNGAIGELTTDKQDKTDYALETTAKTVVGAINEVDGKISNLLTRRNMTNTTQANGAFLIQTSGEYIIPIGFKVVDFPEGYGEVGGYIIRGVDGNYYIMLRDANGTPIANKSYTIQVVFVAQVNLS